MRQRQLPLFFAVARAAARAKKSGNWRSRTPQGVKKNNDWLISIHAEDQRFRSETRFGELLQRVEQGEEIVITRHDRPVARIVREGAPNLDAVKQSVEELRQLQQRIRKRSRGRSGLSAADVRAAIEHGRK